MLKRYRIALFIAIMVTILIASSIAYADDELLNATVQHVDTTLDSEFIHLHLNADVVVPDENVSLPIYISDYARADDAKWKKLFFGSADAPVKDELAGWDLKQQQVFYPELEHNYSAGSLYTKYHAYEARLFVEYKSQNVMVNWHGCKKDVQADGLQTTPAQAKALAQTWIDNLSRGIGWNELTVDTCYAMPASAEDGTPIAASQLKTDESNDKLFPPFYIVECNRKLNSVPVSVDFPPTADCTVISILGDELLIYVNDSGIFRVEGNYRSYQEEKREKLAISLADAMDIVQENMDYLEFIYDRFSYDIPEIGLCYRLVQTLQASDKDVYARTEVRPAWRFASTINRNTCDEFVMFVDAITGEVLP